MGKGLNESIISSVSKECGDDKNLKDFLMELIFAEASHAGRWWSGRHYDQKLDEYCNKLPEKNEDKEH